MAHAARFGALAGELVSSITGRTNQDPDFHALRETTIKGFRDQSHARTNQFAVKQSLDGLVEKFAVRNRDDLAEALQSRLGQLPAESRWLPEILSLLLLLSDKPVENVAIDALDALKEPRLAEAELTWDQILADDPLDEDGIWDDIDRGYHSSGDDATGDELESEHTTSTQATSVDDDLESLAEGHVQQPDVESLDGTRRSRKLAKQLVATGKQQSLSELSIIREILNMMRGLPTSPFDIDEPSGCFILRPNIRCSTASKLVSQNLLSSCADAASKLYALRKWARSNRKAAHVQSMQAAIGILLQDHDCAMGRLERRFASPLSGIVMSIIDVGADIEALVSPLVHLSNTITAAETAEKASASPFSLIDALYDEACIAHTSGDVQLFDTVVRVFSAGLNAYLKPVATWTKTGTLPPAHVETFFVKAADTSCPLGKVWHDRWSLRLQQNSAPCTPSFVQSFVAQAFAMGKAKAFAKLLSPGSVSADDMASCSENPADSGDIQRRCSNDSLLPFSQLIEDVVRAAVQGPDNGTLSSSKQLLHHHGLLQLLRTVPYAFFSKDGALFQSFAETLFSQAQRRKLSAASDGFLLTELAQATLGTALTVDSASIVIIIGNNETAKSSDMVMSRLANIGMHQALAWPVQNVLRSATLHTHSEVFTLVLQLTYAKSILTPELFTLRHLDCKSNDLNTSLRAALRLRFGLQWFVAVFHEHITTTSIELHDQMCARMEDAGGIDVMSSIWSAYTTRLESTMLLAQNLAPIKTAIMEMLQDCEHFDGLWRSLTPTLHTASQSGLSSSAVRNPIGDDADAMLGRFKRTLAFIRAGLRGVGRASGESTLEALADRLDWGGG